MKVLNECGEKLLKPWFSVPNILIVLALIYGAGLLIRIYDLKNSDIAAWVQAFGSVAAILTAVRIAHRDSELRQATEVQSRRGALVRAQTVVLDAEERVTSAFEAANKMNMNEVLAKTLAGHLKQSRGYLTEAMLVQGLDSDIYTELFKVRKAVEDTELLLPGVGSIETASDEETLRKSIAAAAKKLTEI